MKPTKEAKERVAEVCAVYGGQKNALYALDRQLVVARDGLWELRVANAMLTVALRDLHTAADEAMGDTDIDEDGSKLLRAMRQALAVLERLGPGTPTED